MHSKEPCVHSKEPYIHMSIGQGAECRSANRAETPQKVSKEPYLYALKRAKHAVYALKRALCALKRGIYSHVKKTRSRMP